MNYTQLSQQIHAAQVAKGFYDEPKTNVEIMLLIASEAFELFDCHRKNKFAQKEHLDYFLGLKSWGQFDVDLFEKTLKTTFEFELCDIIIRVLDFAGYKNVNIDTETNSDYLFEKQSFIDDMHLLVVYIMSLTENGEDKFCKFIICVLKSFAKKYGIDFEPLISIKLAYNATLPYKHGKRY